MQEADQRIGDARFADEFGDGVEHRGVIMIEAHDHAAQHVDAVPLDAADALKQSAGVRPHIQNLLRFQERVLVRTFNADKDALEIGEPHQLHELLVLGKVDRGLGES
jgi:hypothetical protein